MGRRAVKKRQTPGLLDADSAPSIAEQVRQSLQDEEAARCVALEGATGKPVKRRTTDAPRVRVGPQALCQDVDVLERVHQYDYELADHAFREYAKRRGVLSVAGVPDSGRWRIFARHETTKDEYLADPYFQFAQEFEGTRHRYSSEAMESNWRVICYGRAVLQDCWEVYCATRTPDDECAQPR